MERIIKILFISLVVSAAMYGLYIANLNTKTVSNQYVVFTPPAYHSPAWVRFFLYKEAVYKNKLSYEDFKILRSVVNCESGFKVKIEGDNGLAYGLAQFHEETFNTFKEEAGMDLKYKEPIDQITLLVWGYKNRKMSHWTCYGMIARN